MSTQFVFERLGIALLLGLLVGLQREKANSALAGFRTFPLITLFGTLSALLSESYGPAPLVGGLFGIIALIGVGNLPALRSDGPSSGITTEIAMLAMYALGAYLICGKTLVAISVGGTIAVLLQFKPELHGFALKLRDPDIKAIMRFVLLSFIILPILPNETFGPFEVLNPHDIWLMVVFIVGLNLTGYIGSKFVSATAGTFTSGILGGLISSTATTLSFSQIARRDEKAVPRATTIILIASTFVYTRILFEAAAVSTTLFKEMILSFVLLFAFSLLLCLHSYFSGRKKSQGESPDSSPPGGVRPALIFGLTYAAVVFATAAAKKYLGPNALYWVAGVSGLTDVDAITLSTGRLVSRGQLEASQGKIMIMIGTLSNLAFKAGIVAVSGNRRLFRRLGVRFGLCILFGVFLILW